MRALAILLATYAASFGYVDEPQHRTTCSTDYWFTQGPYGGLCGGNNTEFLIEVAAEAWNGANTGFTFTKDLTGGSMNYWVWVDTPTAIPGFYENVDWAAATSNHAPGDVIEYTITGLNLSPGYLDPFDNTYYEYYIQCNTSGPLDDYEIDLYSIILHEFGHWYRLAHSDKSCAVVALLDPADIADGGFRKQHLTNDDVNGARRMYSNN